MKKKLLAALAAMTILSMAACSFQNHTNVQANVSNSGSSLTVETSDGNKETTFNISSDNPGVVSVETNDGKNNNTSDGNAGTDTSDTNATDNNANSTANTSILPITDDTALSAVQNLCLEENNGIVDVLAKGETPLYWVVESSDDKQVVVLYRSYTGSETRFYIDRVSGETYETDLVPGIIDEETENGVTFNVRDYIDLDWRIVIPGMWQTNSIVMTDDNNMVPEHYVQFTSTQIVYGHMTNGSFIPEYSDKIFVSEELASGGYMVKSINSSGIKYTYLTSESDANILEYYETWDEYDYADKYFGGASLSKCE